MKIASIEITNQIENLTSLLEEIEELLTGFEIKPKLMFNIQLCIDEAVTNTINYGYLDKSDGKITVEIDINKNIINFKITDDAVQFNPLLVPEPDVNVSLEERKIGGLGIFLIKKLTLSQKYEYKNNFNVLEFEFEIQ